MNTPAHTHRLAGTILSVALAILLLGMLALNMDDPSVFLLVLFVLVFVVVPAVIITVRNPRMVEKWATRNGYQLVDQERRYTQTGPFPPRSARTRAIYRITIVDAEGQQRSGWAICGNRFFGGLTNEIAVQWDEPAPDQPDQPDQSDQSDKNSEEREKQQREATERG